MPAAEARERIKFRAAAEFAGLPFGRDPAFLLELVQRRVERSVADLQHVARDLLQALADGPAVEWLESENFQQQEVESALDEIGWFAQCRISSVTEIIS